MNQIVVLYLSSTSNHNCYACLINKSRVVLYLSSTSNHNGFFEKSLKKHVVLYLSSTSNHNRVCAICAWISGCVISFFYIKPQPIKTNTTIIGGCVISFFYIKPQQCLSYALLSSVVLYLSSTSNHNPSVVLIEKNGVVLYLSSTSNHNRTGRLSKTITVVLYLSSTSNHNFWIILFV